MNDNVLRSSRRQVIRVASAAGVVAATGNSADAASVAAPLQNVAEIYPKPPFPPQSQEWPGLASKMTPRPDHGERSYVGTGRLAGRKALITGGDSGMGRGAAIAFAREGADVVICHLPSEQSDALEVLDLIQQAGRKGFSIPGDIRDESFCNQLVTQAVQSLGGLDILVNNAARQTTQRSLGDITTEQFDATLKTNLYAMFWITKAALQHLPAGATIINTASEQAYDPSEDLVDYAQTKAAIVSFTKSMGKQLAKKGIRVNAVAPGPIWTPLQVSGGATQAKLVTFGSTTPMGRPGQPGELASIYVQLAANEATYTTGQIYGATGANGGP